jgi:hypothetical protein
MPAHNPPHKEQRQGHAIVPFQPNGSIGLIGRLMQARLFTGLAWSK